MEPNAPLLDPEVVADMAVRTGAVSRRDALRQTALLGTALAASPLALAALSTKAYGQSAPPENIAAILRFALTLEHLEYEFYRDGLAANTAPSTPLIAQTERSLFTTIADHEEAHVLFLQNALRLDEGTGAGAPGRPEFGFDFTAGGTLDTLTNYQTYLAVSQGLEDTGVRAYKGQAPGLIESDAILTAALQIHAVEARHASAVRRVRGLKGWITGNQNEVAAIQATYNGEENVTQAGVDLQAALGGTYGADAVSEAFDEPLTMEQVLAIAGPFIRTSAP